MKKVLVTGVSGFVGQHCAVELLKAGYSVKGSVRSMAKAEHITKSLGEVVETEGRLEFCELNLLEDRGWEESMTDCDYLLHVASPYVGKEPKDEDDLIRPATEGTIRALKAAHKAGVKKVVLTSSMVAMLGEMNGSIPIEQNTWTNSNSKNASAYVKSKTIAERMAWDFMDDLKRSDQMQLVVVNPGPIFGPTISGNLTGESMTMSKNMITGKMPMLPKAGINMTDVRDVARIQVLALENEKANGQRFVVASQNAYTFKQVAQILKDAGYDKVSTKEAPNWFLKLMANFSPDLKGMKPFIGSIYDANLTPTMEVFDWTPITIEKTMIDTAESIEKVLKG
ncbi:MAG: NAD-dependent epimerase/dehydratase family protein [Flavobacteriaceae bacterium]